MTPRCTEINRLACKDAYEGGIFLGPDAPFGGYKQSGLGREMGPEGIDKYLETKTIAIPA